MVIEMNESVVRLGLYPGSMYSQFTSGLLLVMQVFNLYTKILA